jgi:hypothetical protein
MPSGWGEGFRSAQEMLPVLRTLLSQLGSEERTVRLLGVQPDAREKYAAR